MQYNKTAPVVEGGILVAVAVIFALISVYIPIIGTLVNLIWPVPIILLGVRHGYKWSIMATAVAGMLLAVMMHPLQAVGVIVGFGLIGIVLGYAFRRGFSPLKILLCGAAASFVSKICVIALATFVMGFNPMNFDPETVNTLITQVIDFYKGMGISAAQLAQVEDMMRSMAELLRIILPAGFVLAAMCDAYLNFWVAGKILRRLGHDVQFLPPFSVWRLPRVFLGGFVAALVLVYWGHAHEAQLLYKVGMNLQIVCSIALFIHGLALFFFLAGRYKLSKAVRIIVLVLIFFNAFFSQIIVFAGAFDMLFDYRQRLERPRQ